MTQNVFSEIYVKDIWDGGSGPGSLPANTAYYRAFLENFIDENSITRVTDLGCGDWQFSRYINWSGVKYLGLDVVEDVVGRNNERFGSDNIEFQICNSPSLLPAGELILCKEVLQHLPNDAVQEYLVAMRERYRYIIITNSVGPFGTLNSDIGPGGFRPLRIDLPPFNAKGAYVLTYCPVKAKDTWIVKNSVFLMLGLQGSVDF